MTIQNAGVAIYLESVVFQLLANCRTWWTPV